MRADKWLCGVLALLLPLSGYADSGMLRFPSTSDGRQVLAVDLHTHSAFSDGRVWPSLRVEEAERDGLAAFAVTEHLEWQPNAQDLPHPDRNRPYEIARKRAEEGDVQVINGAEISRGPGIGHINAVFIEDANRLLTQENPSASSWSDYKARFFGYDESTRQDALRALREARSQGAFIFLNHPSLPGQSPDGRGRLSEFHKQAIEEGLLDGIEVSNRGHYSADAFRIALAHDLAILGTSDVHGLIAWDYADEDDHLSPGSRGARTVTLVLVGHGGSSAIREALDDHQTVALNDNQLFGRSGVLRPLLEGALSFSIGERVTSDAGVSSVYELQIHNASPIPLSLENVSGRVFSNSSNFFTVPPRDEVQVEIAELPDPGAMTGLKVRVVNAFSAPGEPEVVEIKRGKLE